jgi:hypothetical protein
MPQVGVIHLALQNDSTGSVLRYVSHASAIFILLLVYSYEYDTKLLLQLAE